jgi:penicillin-binding protein 1C
MAALTPARCSQIGFGLRRGLRRGAGRWVVVSLLLAGAFVCYVRCAPLAAPESRMEMPGTVVLDANGVVLQRDAAAGLRIPVELGQIAPLMQRATIAAEDQRFEEHPGIDLVAATRALVQYRSQPSGASTITEQLARRLYLRDSSEPLLMRKAHEALLALQLESHRSKGEILRDYLNEVYYGRGSYGVEAAARVFFGVSAGNLDLAQAAFLAGLPQLPSAYDPANGIAPATERQRYVLGRMRSDGDITAEEQAAAKAEELILLPAATPVIAPHFVNYALDELQRVRPDLAGERGLVIETTLDSGLQLEAERLANYQLLKLKGKDVTDAAVVVLAPGSGAIKTMVGSANFDDAANGGQINMATTPRQPGSALKPFLYAAAFEQGYTPESALLDVPVTFQTEQGPYAPLNYDRRFHGVVPLRVALASSFNVPAVRTLDALGINAFLDIAHRFGLSTLTDSGSYGLSLVLGGGEVRLIDLTAAYGALAAEGELSSPFSITRILDTQGHVLYEHPPSRTRRVVSAQHAYQIADILSDPDARIPGFGQVTPLDTPFKAAVKTGTTTGFKDNWTLGFTPALSVGVWVGNADNSPMQDVSGVDGAGPLWRDVMEAAVGKGDPGWLKRPAGLVEATVCAPTGLLPGPACPSPVTDTFVAGTVPTSTEQYYARADDGRLVVNPPAEARSWAVDAGLALAPGVAGLAGQALQVVAPAPGSVYYLSPELAAQQFMLRATAPPGTQEITFTVDGAAAGTVPGSEGKLVWQLVPGVHSVSAHSILADGSTATATSRYEVKAR